VSKCQAQVIGIIAEAGMGKSRLVAEVIRLARKNGFVGYGGACQSDGIVTPYLAWKSIWSAFFDIDPAAPLKKQIRSVENVIGDYAPSRLQAIPLLNVVLDLAMPENDFTSNLEPQYRKSALTALFEDCLRTAAIDEPILIVIEDVHWIDGLSHDLLEDLTRMLVDSRICFVLAYRPSQMTRLQAPGVEALPQFTKIELHELNQSEAEQAIRTKLAQLYPARSDAVPAQLVDKLMRRTQGNPFFLEELLNYFRDRGLDPRDPTDLEKIELPDSLHALVLSRIDQLSEREKTTLRVASIVGRLFHATWLTGYYPALGDLAHVKVDLDKLESLDITPLDSETERVYLFKHNITHEVTYENLPFGLRAQLHEQLARYLEREIDNGIMTEAALLDTLVFHYSRSKNQAKQRLYLQKAGQAALDTSAFASAVEYFTRLLEIMPANDPSRSGLASQSAEAHERLGDFPAAHLALKQAQAAAQTDTDRAMALTRLGNILRRTGDYTEAQRILEQAVSLARLSRDPFILCRALSALGSRYIDLGKLDDAKVILEENLMLAHTLGVTSLELSALYPLGHIARMQGDLVDAERLYTETYTKATMAGNRLFVMWANTGLSIVADDRGENVLSQEYGRQSLAIAREIGAHDQIALNLINQADGDIKLGELATARKELLEGLAQAFRLGAFGLLPGAVMYFGKLAYAEGQIEQALELFGLARSHPAWHAEGQSEMEMTLAVWDLDPSVVEVGMAKGARLDWDKTIDKLLKG
jgi:adenylate cyclase